MAPRRKPAGAPLSGPPSQEISEGGLLHHDFRGASWGCWQAILRAAFAELLTDAELAMFREVAGGREPPKKRVRELHIVAGRRGGKDSIAAAIATCAALQDYSAYLRTGELASVVCLAVNRDQARIVHGYIAGYFSSLPALKPLVVRQTDEVLTLGNGVEVVVSTANFRSIRGKTIAVAILDEVAYWRSEDTANPDREIFNAIEPATLTIPSAMIIGISSPFKRGGLLYERWQSYFGKDDDDVLVIHAPSRTLNPTLPQHIIDRRLAEDPEAGAAEYLAEWRSDLSDFLDRELVSAAVDDVTVRSPVPGVEYQMFVDASGGRGDFFAAAVAHAEGDLAVIDCLYEARSPFNATVVVGEVAELEFDSDRGRNTCWPELIDDIG